MDTEKLISEVDNPYAALAYAMKKLDEKNQANYNKQESSEPEQEDDSLAEIGYRLDDIEQRLTDLEKVLAIGQDQSIGNEDEPVKDSLTDDNNSSVKKEESSSKGGNNFSEHDKQSSSSSSIQSKDGNSFSNTSFECPQCGEIISVDKWSQHVSTSNLRNITDHDPLSRVLQVNDDGGFYLPHIDESFDEYEKAGSKLKNIGYTLGEYIYKHRETLGVEDWFETPYDKDGNLVIRDDKRDRISELSNSGLEDKIISYLDGKSSRVTMKTIGSDLFDIELETGTGKYSKMYRVLRESDSISSDNSSNVNEYWVGDDPLKSSEEDPNLARDVLNLVGGKNNYKVLLHAISKLAPREPGRVDISYYGGDDSKAFTSVFSGAKDLEADKSWEMLHDKPRLVNAISDYLGEEYQIKSAKASNVVSQDPIKAWNMIIYRKQNS